jgi:hypothetical protein
MCECIWASVREFVKDCYEVSSLDVWETALCVCVCGCDRFLSHQLVVRVYMTVLGQGASVCRLWGVCPRQWLGDFYSEVIFPEFACHAVKMSNVFLTMPSDWELGLTLCYCVHVCVSVLIVFTPCCWNRNIWMLYVENVRETPEKWLLHEEYTGQNIQHWKIFGNYIRCIICELD